MVIPRYTQEIQQGSTRKVRTDTPPTYPQAIHSLPSIYPQVARVIHSMHYSYPQVSLSYPQARPRYPQAGPQKSIELTTGIPWPSRGHTPPPLWGQPGEAEAERPDTRLYQILKLDVCLMACTMVCLGLPFLIPTNDPQDAVSPRLVHRYMLYRI